jgi:acyl dehydratase
MPTLITPATPIGAEFRGPLRALSPGRVRCFSGGSLDEPSWPLRNLHTDPAKAADAGLSHCIVSGMQYEGHLIELLLDLFGDAWQQSGEMSVKYPATVSVGDEVRSAARIGAINFDGRDPIVELDVSCVRADGAVVLVGRARCPIHSAPGAS